MSNSAVVEKFYSVRKVESGLLLPIYRLRDIEDTVLQEAISHDYRIRYSIVSKSIIRRLND